MLDCVAKHEWRHAGHFLELVDRLAQILFFQVVEIERIEFLEDPLQIALQSSRGLERIGQSRKHLAELRDGGDTDFIPIEELLFALGHSFVS